MKRISKLSRELNGQPRRVIAGISLLVFLVSFLLGFASGLVFREFRLKLLVARQKAQKLEEEKRFERLLENFSQVKFSPTK